MHFDEKFWIALAFVLFISLVYKKIAKVISSALEKKIADIKNDLEKAEDLKEEAQAILANYKKEQEQEEASANNIIKQAKESADKLLKESKKEIETSKKNKLAEINANLEHKKANFVNGLRQEIADKALAITKEYLSENKAEISQKSYTESITSLEKANIS